MFRLGTQLHEAYAVWASRLEHAANVKTINQLLDRYALEVIPTKAAASQVSNQNQIVKVRIAFGEMHLEDVTPQSVYLFVDKRSKKVTNPVTGKTKGGRITAHREVELLSHALTKAVEWGYINKHPFKGEIRLEGEKSRDRYVEDWEVVECLSLAPKRKSGSVLMIQAYLRIKLLTGMAQGDLLRLRTDLHIKEDGIHIQRHKTAKSTGKRTIYEWSPQLRSAVDMALEARPRDSTFLFCNRNGECYINEALGRASGWKSMWQRFMERVLEETKVTTPFTEHDLRAKVGSDADTLEKARALLSHADSRTTERIYRRKAERVSPLK